MQRRSVIPDSEEISERKERRRSTGRKISVVLLVAIIIIAAFLLISQFNRGSCPEGERKENGECVKQPEAPAPITTDPAETSTLISEPGSDEALRDAQPSSSAALP